MANVAGTDIALTISLKNPVNPSHIVAMADYRVIDEEGTVLVDWQNLPTVSLGAESVTITVPASANALKENQTRGGREVEISVTTPNGEEYIVSKTYLLADRSGELAVGENTLVNLAGAELIVGEIPGLQAWTSANRNDRTAALIEAYRRIAGLPIHCDAFRGFLEDLTGNEVKTLDRKLLQAFSRAQLVEAENILAGEPNERSDGVVLETIGEVKKMFKNSKPLKLAVSRKTIDQIAAYVALGAKKVARA